MPGKTQFEVFGEHGPESTLAGDGRLTERADHSGPRVSSVG
jgi:hypothetical protein